MAFEDYSAEERDRLGVAVHEAGHAVFSTLYAGQVISAETYSGGPRTDPRGLGLGGACQYTHDETGQTEAHRAEILAAGTAAQAVWLHGPRPTIGQLNAVLSLNKMDATELRRLAGAFSTPYPPDQALPLVLRAWPAIARLAIAIHQGKQVGHTEVCAALGMPTTNNLHHRHAILQGGSVPRILSPPARHLAAV